MLSEYRRESASNADSDFYRFLHNRSRIKSLSKYFPAKTESSSANISAQYLKETLFKRNKIATLSNKDVENKRYSYSKAKEKEMTEEEKIMNWLTSCEDDSNDNAKRDTEDVRDDKTKNNSKEGDSCKNDGLQDDHFADNAIDGENVQVEDKVSNKMDNKANILNSKELVIPESCLIDNQDASKKIKPESSTDLNDSESVKILKDCAPESCKQKSLPKRSGQRKISDFFQRIS